MDACVNSVNMELEVTKLGKVLPAFHTDHRSDVLMVGFSMFHHQCPLVKRECASIGTTHVDLFFLHTWATVNGYQVSLKLLFSGETRSTSFVFALERSRLFVCSLMSSQMMS